MRADDACAPNDRSIRRRRRVLDDYQSALRRLERWTRLVTELATSPEDPDALPTLVDGLRAMLERAERVEILLLDRYELVPATLGSIGQALLDRLCAAIASMHGLDHTMPLDGAPRLSYLVAPQLIGSSAGRGSIASAPMLWGSTVVGIVVAESAPDGPDFDLADLDSLTRLSAQAAGLVDRHRHATRLAVEKRRLGHDLSLAREIQRQFLPSLPPIIGGFRVAAVYRPAFDVGGDFYDVVEGEDGSITAVIGDVSGKGVAAALVMSRVSSTFRRLAVDCTSPQQLLEQLNETVVGQFPEETFVTAACVRLDAAGRLGVLANAGHVLPLVKRRRSVVPLGFSSGPPLGMAPRETYVQEEFELGTGDVILLSTDGVVEALNPERNPLDLEYLLSLVQATPPDLDELPRRILSAIDRRDDGSRSDDLTLLALEVVATS